VVFLAGLAGPGTRALELAIGGGRVALPLARRGLQVEGVEAVVRRLRAAPGGASLPVVVADMADVPVPRPFGLVYVVWNSLFNLPSQARQVDCPHNVARVQAPGGAFVLECFVPDLAQFDPGVETTEVPEESATITLSRHDPVAQRITRQHVTLDGQGIRLLPVALRYCWPRELDLMAQLAGLRLRERHGDWSRTPSTPAAVGTSRSMSRTNQRCAAPTELTGPMHEGSAAHLTRLSPGRAVGISGGCGS
jgi:hypothetical protein